MAAAVSRTVRLSTPSTARPPQPSPRSGPMGTTPRDALNPYTPQQAAGIRMEPPPSLPCATGTTPVATATAAPPLEPPDERVRSQGFLVTFPYTVASVVGAMHSSGTVVRAYEMNPALSKRSARWESTA